MFKWFFRLLFFGIFFSFFVPGMPAQAVAADDAWSKAGRGINNLLFFPLEITYRPVEMHEKGEIWPTAVAGGGLKGIGYAVARLGVGAYEFLTFPFPGHNHYGPILMPENIFLNN